MLTLLAAQNYRKYKLLSLFNSEHVGVYLKNGELQYFRFLGFADPDHAKATKAKPVRINIYGYYLDGVGTGLTVLKDNESVQGALTNFGVYAIVEKGRPRVVMAGRKLKHGVRF